jgi:hypothetical protein
MTHARRILLPSTLLGACLGGVLLAGSLPAQEAAAPKAPRILQIFQESVKPGRLAAHERHEQGWPLAFSGGKIESYYVALTASTGNNDAWYVGGFDNYAQLEASNQAIAKVPGLEAELSRLSEKDADYIASSRSIMAQLNDSLSIGTPPDFANVKGYRITMLRVRFGHTDEFRQVRRAIREAYTKAGVDPHIGVYAVTAGVNTPTYLIFRPYLSMSDFDGWSQVAAKVNAQYTPEQRQMMDKFEAEGVVTREVNTWAISPRQSYVPAAWVAANPDFWKTNPVVAMRAREREMRASQAGKPKQGTGVQKAP